MTSLFEQESQAQADQEAHDKQVEELCTQIGKKTA
jgi:hypothetical protein